MSNATSFKVGETCKDKSGRDVLILAINSPGKYEGRPQPVIGIAKSTAGFWQQPYAYGTDGRFTYSDSTFDLIPPTRTVFINLYPDGAYGGKHRECVYSEWSSKAEAEAMATRHAAAIAVPVTIPA